MDCGRDVPQQVVGSGGGLQIWDLGDAGEEAFVLALSASRQGCRERTRLCRAACEEREGLDAIIPCPNGVLHAASASDGADIATAAPPANSAGTSVALTRAAGSWLDGLDLSAEFRTPVPTLQTVTRFLITGVRHALVAALGAIRAAHEGRDEAARVRAWKLFLLLPRLLLARSAQIGADGRAALMRRIELFRQGRVDELHAQSAAEHEQAHPRRRGGDNEAARAAAACAKVRRGQVSRARQMLTAAALAPGNAATLEALTDPARRPPHPLRSPAPEVLQYRPSEEVVLMAHQVGEALRTSKRGSAAGLSGASCFLMMLRHSSHSRLQ